MNSNLDRIQKSIKLRKLRSVVIRQENSIFGGNPNTNVYLYAAHHIFVAERQFSTSNWNIFSSPFSIIFTFSLHYRSDPFDMASINLFSIILGINCKFFWINLKLKSTPCQFGNLLKYAMKLGRIKIIKADQSNFIHILFIIYCKNL